ncbi:hypothetical protein pipiens_014310 [Culex pipiens pipiens]|uniref:MYND-type domain-containing protein n=1 Tax=Culex pipiens pipiens TaxID=38569 RepID=A0ABD1CV98_CULPP
MDTDAQDSLLQFVWDRVAAVFEECERTHGLLEALPARTPDRLRFVASVVERVGAMGRLAERVPGGKDCFRAAEMRMEGNKFMRSSGPRDLLAAAEAYNRALAYAPEDSGELRKAYSNRSAVCYALREYRLCLDNIEAALRIKAPAPDPALEEKLRTKQLACRKLLADERVCHQFEQFCYAKLSYGPNLTNSRVVDGVVESEGQLVARKDFVVGDVLMIDEPYVTVIDGKDRYTRCHHCLRDRFLELRPCPDCVVAMFCSKLCAQQAQQRYHRFECPVLHRLFEIYHIATLVPLRIVCTAIDTFGDDLDRLEEHIQKIDPDFNPFQLNWNKVTREQLYDAMHVLPTNESQRAPMLNLFLATESIVVTEIMFRHSPQLRQLANTEAKQDLIRQLVYHHTMTSAFSARHINQDNGLGSYPLLAAANHSCIPNTIRVVLPGGKNALVTYRPIQAGDQILISKGVLFSKHPKQFRQDRLNSLFQIQCRCEACTFDYPTVWLDHSDCPLEPADQTQLNQIERLLDRAKPPAVSCHAVRTALEAVVLLMRKYVPLVPTRNLRQLTELFSRCHVLLFHGVPARQRYAQQGLC